MNAIYEAKRIIATQIAYNRIFQFGASYSEYQRCYFWTNENVKKYLELADFANKCNALTVASSGDQAFNLINKGILNIDTFDVNRLTEYFAFGLKRAMISKYDYQSFCKNICELRESNNIEYVSDIIMGLLPYMENEHALYWKMLVDYNKDLQQEFGTNLNLMLMLTFEREVDIFKRGFNNYLSNEFEYEKLRKNLGNANITFNYVNAKDLTKSFDKKYDFILLSNILSYFNGIWGDVWTVDKLNAYIKELEKITNIDGVMFLQYLMFYIQNGKESNILFQDSSVMKSDLSDLEIHEIALDYTKEASDGIILKRVRG